jgi:hypothetical protein
VQQIVQAGDATLAKVFENLDGKRTGHDGWNEFILLVDHHCPQDGTQYTPPFDNIFPVADLQYLTGPSTTSWHTNGRANQIGIYLDKATQVRAHLLMDNDNDVLLDMPYVTDIDAGRRFVYVSFNVLPQGQPFAPTKVKFWVRYADKFIEHYTTIVAPEDVPMPKLEIVPMPANIPCQRAFVEGTAQEFVVKNLSVFSDRSNLGFSWQVSGAAAAANHADTLSIGELPPAGSTVRIDVTVTSQAGLSRGIQAKGTFTFVTTKQEVTLGDMLDEINCRLRGIRNMQARTLIPPVEQRGKVRPEDLAEVESVAKQVTAAARAVTAMASKAKELAGGR